MEILGTNRLIPRGFELGTTLTWPNKSMVAGSVPQQAESDFTYLVDQKNGDRMIKPTNIELGYRKIS